MDATGPPLRSIICKGTDISNAKAQLFKRLTVIKKKVYIIHDFSGIALSFKKNDRGPADRDKKYGRVSTAMTTN